MDNDVWNRLGQAVKDRRLELGLSVRAAATIAEINRATWGTLEEGDRRLSRHLWKGVEGALAWAPGSVSRILAGGDPTPLPDDHPEVVVPALPPDFDLGAEIERVSRLDIPAKTKLELARRITDLYEQAQAEHRQAQAEHRADR